MTDQTSSPPTNQTRLTEGRPRLLRLRLQTHLLEQMRRFYQEVLGFEILTETLQSVTFAAGATQLEFAQVTDDSQPYYHFAFNIPENKIEQAKEWLEKRVSILRHAQTGEEMIFFEAWNAHALFFYDPAGSLVELIARHTLPNATDGLFGPHEILYASEIGIVPPELEPISSEIQQRFKLARYLNSPVFLGDEYGIIILINQQTRWTPEYKKGGALYPAQIMLTGHGEGTLRFHDLPFEIVGIAARQQS